MKIRYTLIGACALFALSGCGNTTDSSVFSPAAVPQQVQFRSIDGSANTSNGAGAAGLPLLRRMSAYADGISSPAGPSRASARAISNACCAQAVSMPDPGRRTNMLWSWGQFIDHDISLTDTGNESMPIPVPLGDPQFDPTSSGTQTMPFSRSEFDATSGTGPTNVRAQTNRITAFLDGSMVYGSDQTRANALRTFSGGRLATSAGDLPPFNTAGLEVANGLNANPATLFLCGDVRANEHIALTSFHTLFLREHNRLAGLLAAADPTLTDEQLYQQARKIVGALIQVISYQEFLPALVGNFPAYTGYDSTVDPGIDVLFSTAGYRLGHTMVSPTLPRLQANGQPIAQGNLAIRDGFFQPQLLVQEGGIDPVFRGLANSSMQTVDTRLVDDLRNFLFGPPGAGGLDLASLNLQRGRDHGLPDYNSVRVQFGLPAATSFADITSAVAHQQQLAMAYASVNDIDPWVGLLSEDPVAGGVVGPTLRAILVEQFQRLRTGDRFYYRNDPSLGPLLGVLEATRLSDVIRRNSDANVQDAVFFLP